MNIPLFSGFRSIRGKLIVAAVLPLILILLLVALAASFLINAFIVEHAQKQIQNDLKAARVVLNQEQLRLHEVVRLTAGSLSFTDALQAGEKKKLHQLLAQTRKQKKIDILNITDTQGELLLKHCDTKGAGPDDPAAAYRVSLWGDNAE